MAISKRTRFEVLRRDGFRCYYCGTRGNETTGGGLTIDHVVAVALGGTEGYAGGVAEDRDLIARLIDGRTDTFTWQRLSHVA